MYEASTFTGDDHRNELGPEPGTCDDCGAGPADRCTATCACDSCEEQMLLELGVMEGVA